MSRRRRAVKRQILPDPKYNSVLATRFINCLMTRGKKSVAERIFYNAVEMVTRRSDQQGIDVFLKAVENCKPIVITKSRRVGSQTYQVPLEVRPEERTTRASSGSSGTPGNAPKGQWRTGSPTSFWRHPKGKEGPCGPR